MKPWQIALFVIAAVVLGGSLAFSFMGGKSVQKSDRIHLVDIETGQLYYAPVKARGSVIVPARHPETRQRTLYVVIEQEDGSWMIDRRTSVGLDLSKVGRVSGAGSVDVIDGDPIRYEPPPFD